MATITPEQLANHAQWLADPSTGERLNLQGADLRKANLREADLQGADLRKANLREANLQGADLRKANLREANLREANLRWADLCGANLQGAHLREANLLWANLRDADLQVAKGLPIASDAPERLQAVARAVISNPKALYMGSWHTCETTHCLAGWAIHQAGELGRLLEAAVGPHMAGLQLLGVEAAEHFYDSNEDVLAWLEAIVK